MLDAIDFTAFLNEDILLLSSISKIDYVYKGIKLAKLEHTMIGKEVHAFLNMGRDQSRTLVY